MSDLRNQEYLSGLRSALKERLKQKQWSLTDASKRCKVPKSELDRLMKSPFGMISVRRSTISKLLRAAYARPNLWDAHTVRMLRTCRDYNEMFA